jgi:hypothetical protein
MKGAYKPNSKGRL